MKEIFITVDGSGSNSSRNSFFWKSVLAICLYLNMVGCAALLEAYTTPSSGTQPSSASSCTDVEFIGIYRITPVPGVSIYTVKIRNKATYTKNATVEFVDMYGQIQKRSFNVKAGEMIEGELTRGGSGDRKPLNVRLSSCY